MTTRPTKYSPLPSEGGATVLEVDVEQSAKGDKAALLDASATTGPLVFVRNGYLSIRCPQITFIESWDQAFIFCSYIGLYLCYGAWVHVTQSIRYSATMMILSVLMTKLVVSIIAYVIVDGSIPQLVNTILLHRKPLCLFIFPAFAYATTDSLGVYCLRHLDPSTFAILYNIRVVFMLILFQHFMRTPLRKPHWVAMGMVISACVVKELPRALFPAEKATVDPLATATAVVEPTSRIVTVLILLLMAQLAAFAAVYNEKLLKEQQLSLNVQNIAMYFWAILATTIFSIIVPLFQENGNVLTDIGNLEMWKTIWSYPIIVAVFLSATYGLVTSFFIKSLNNVVREIACAIHIIGTIPVNVFFFRYSVQPTDILAVTGVLFGVYLYNRHPLKK